MFLIYIIDLAEYLSLNSKLFDDDASLYSVVHDLNTSANEINDDLKKIEAWDHQWKMSFNPDPLKQRQEVIFSRKRNKPHHPDIKSHVIGKLYPVSLFPQNLVYIQFPFSSFLLQSASGISKCGSYHKVRRSSCYSGVVTLSYFLYIFS